MSAEARVLINAGGVNGLLARDPTLVVLDVRWALGDPHGRAHHAAGHIPGAVAPTRGDVTLAPWSLPVLGAEEAAALARTGLL
ncbi:MAG: hypothetical protein M3065_15760, partial [Actinomycetota bacterium]|nr:hypothetical protein [Actinomycetota bacterium]